MMTTPDKTLLEKAAKAAGFQNYTMSLDTVFVETGSRRGDSGNYWNPLTDDGDALRLAVKCNLWIGQHDDGVTVSDAYGRFKGALEEDYGDDPHEATRRAIVRAAAAIGEKL